MAAKKATEQVADDQVDGDVIDIDAELAADDTDVAAEAVPAAGDGTVWFELHGQKFHVEVGSPAFDRLSAEGSGAVVCDPPEG